MTATGFVILSAAKDLSPTYGESPGDTKEARNFSDKYLVLPFVAASQLKVGEP